MSQPKLDFLNQQHISCRLSSSDPTHATELVARARRLLSPFADDESQYPHEYVHKVLYLMKVSHQAV